MNPSRNVPRENASTARTPAPPVGSNAHPSAVELGYYLRPFMLSCLPLRRPSLSKEEWVRSDAQAEFRVVPDARYGMPYGQDRLVLLLLATHAMEQNRRRIALGSAYEILRWFGLPPDGRNYGRLAERFNRVLGAKIFCTYWIRRGGKRTVLRRSRINYRDIQLWTQQTESRRNRSVQHFENSLTVSMGFWDELHRNPGQAEMDVVRALAGSPGRLAL